jgi:DNA-binding LytR/AlgR family response regulator
MNPVKILITEDEFPIALDMKWRLEKMGYEVQGIVASYEEVLLCLAGQPADLVLMDIQLRGQKTGIDAARTLYSTFHIPVVFVTAFSDAATINQALEVMPFGYIIKPFKDADIDAAVKVALEKHRLLSSQQKQLEWLKQQAGSAAVPPVAIFVKHKGQLEKVMVDDIFLLEAVDNYTAIYTARQKYLLPSVLKNIHSQLPAATFIRVHKSFVINTAAINTVEENAVYLRQHSPAIPIGKLYRQAFMQALNILH